MTEKTEQMKLLDSSQAKLALSWKNEPSEKYIMYPTMLDPSIVGKRELDSSATRFEAPDWKKMTENAAAKKKSLEEEEISFKLLTNQEFVLGARRKAENSKKINLDDLVDGTISTKEPLSPKVGGFAFVMDPSATPSKHAPIVTWGEIEGTPLLLDPTTPLHVGGGAANIAPSEFAVPQTPRRDQVGHDLADKVRQKQAQKKKAEKVSKTQGNATPRSETAQKLINKLKRTPADPQLRASYTPIVHDSASSW